MKQILQSLSSGTVSVTEVPCPRLEPANLLIRTSKSLISAGTERMLLEFGKANLLSKARQQPDRVRRVLEKVRTDGIAPTLESVRNRLDRPQALGYCNVGTVMEAGKAVSGFAAGDRVASNGQHAEACSVPANLCAGVPENVSDEAAAFTVVGAIALQGVRLAQPTLGETFVVTGLGLIGLLAVQILRANGCRVLGIDPDQQKLSLAQGFGAETVDIGAGEDPVSAGLRFSQGRGVDGVVVTASTTSNEPVHQAALMSRKRGRIVLVGVVGLELSRADFYEKELSFQVSCSYGPGRYDPNYEEGGQDYPIGFVRWTAQRNFEAVLDMLADGRLNVAPLISHRFPLDRAQQAYDLLTSSTPSLGVVLEYPSLCAAARSDEQLRARTVQLAARRTEPIPGAPVVGFLGAGNYASQVLIPAFKKAGVRLNTVVSTRGVGSVHAGRKYGFVNAATDWTAVSENPDIDVVVIATRHDSHARFVCDLLNAEKHVFVEKPLALKREELDEIEGVYAAGASKAKSPVLMVGFNRRFAPQVQKLKELLSGVREPKAFVFTANAGAVSPDHWALDPAIGGGRIIGEACHFVDLLRCLAGAPIVSVQAALLAPDGAGEGRDHSVSFTLCFADGSTGTVHYLTGGHGSFPKERLEVFCAGRILQLDNFRRLRGFGWPGFRRMNLWRQDKGNQACVAAFVDALRRGQPSPIPFDELLEVTRVTFDVVDAVRVGRQ